MNQKREPRKHTEKHGKCQPTVRFREFPWFIGLAG